jgi:hypothetical protein
MVQEREGRLETLVEQEELWHPSKQEQVVPRVVSSMLT